MVSRKGACTGSRLLSFLYAVARKHESAFPVTTGGISLVIAQYWYGEESRRSPDLRLRRVRAGHATARASPGASERLHIEPQVFDVLAHLFACRDRVVTKEELLDRVWGHRYVAPTTFNSRIKHARQAVGDDGATQRVIRTVHGLGFRVVANVDERTVRRRTSTASARS